MGLAGDQQSLCELSQEMKQQIDIVYSSAFQLTQQKKFRKAEIGGWIQENLVIKWMALEKGCDTGVNVPSHTPFLKAEWPFRMRTIKGDHRDAYECRFLQLR